MYLLDRYLYLLTYHTYVMTELKFIAEVSKLTTRKETKKMLFNIPKDLWGEAEKLRGKPLKIIVTEAI